MVKFSSSSFETREYESIDNHILAAAVTGKSGEFYYLLVEEGKSSTTQKKASLFRASTEESKIVRQ